MNLFQLIILAIISLSSSIVSTISGGGGGTLVVPAIVATINEKPSILVGSVFMLYLAGAVTGLIVYRERGLIDLKSGLILAIPTIPGVIAGTLLENYISRFQFNLSLGILTTILASMLIIFRKKTQTVQVQNTDHQIYKAQDKTTNSTTVSDKLRRTLKDKSGRVFTYSPRYAIGIAINLCAAFVGGLFGAGAALLIAPTAILFVKMPSHVAIATTRVVIVTLDITALLTHIDLGTINFSYALILSIGGIIGAIIGARIAFSIKPDLLTKLIAIILGLFGLYLVTASIV